MDTIREVRLTLAALIYALETDLRSLIKNYLVPQFKDLSFIKDDILQQRVQERFSKDNLGLDPNNNTYAVVDYIDFQDSYKIVLKNKECFTPQLINEIKTLVPKLDSIASIRNRVMHARPLLSGDFSNVYRFVSNLKPLAGLPWTTVINTKKGLDEDPDFILKLNYPYAIYKDSSDSSVYHQLPFPDFDETGFIGREKDIDAIRKLLMGAQQVVTIVGDGGIGKSSLALKIAYDFLDMDVNCPFDMILWTTAKSSILTPKGIEEIAGAITSFSGVVEDVANSVGAPINDLQSNMNEISEYLDTYKTLLIIDNLETILNDAIRQFIREISQKCKILITSRIGLGELEYPRTLEGLSENEASLLIREMAKMRNSQVLQTLQNSKLVEISKKFHYNPLSIKWFVNSVESGKSINEVMSDKKELFTYCLSNVYENLTYTAQTVLQTLLAARKSLHEAELCYLSEIEPFELKKALLKLTPTTMITREAKDNTLIYSVSDFTKEYLSQHHSPKPDFFKKIADKQNKLNSGLEDAKRISMHNKYDLNAIRGDNVVIRVIQEALLLSKKRNYDEALRRIEFAKQNAPGCVDAYRISAFIKAQKGDYLGAENEYLCGLEVEPSNQRLIYFYANFLLFYLHDNNKALEYANKLYALDEKSPESIILLARCVAYNGEIENGIELIEKLIKNSILTNKQKKISSTLLIDFYKRWAEHKIDIEKDYNTAIEYISKGLNHFDYCVNGDYIDEKLITEFIELFVIFFNKIPKHCHPKSETIFKHVKTYENLISQRHQAEFIFKNTIKYSNIELSNILIKDVLKVEEETNRINGIVDFFDYNKLYGFINGNNSSRYFFHLNNIINYDGITPIGKETFASFEIGKNDKGECAVKVILKG